MSAATHLSGNPDKIFHKPPHRRNASTELDVFEAARYFSGSNELIYTNTSSFTHNIIREDHSSRRGGRMSLDLPLRTNAAPPPPYTAEKPPIKEKKHRQQPSSPAGRLANFLNSLFNQSASQKKKKPKNGMKNDEFHHEIGARKRRSSLSSLIDSKSSSNISAPNKNYKQIRNLLDQTRPASKNLGNVKQNSDHPTRKIKDVDQDARSDSSSDLFELRIYDFD
ncbi:protein BIG GRAIN 1-like E [Cucurbita moschata]|uniref:Protein BIG GRAIN 1-like E n=2 Tax=Cucurbita TaxID=3660 RepID=A0A6J1G172_CUCMO